MSMQKQPEEPLALDPVTGVSTRAFFDTRCNQEWRRGTRDGSSLSLLMIEIDGFKTARSSSGKSDADDCLNRVAAVLRSNLSRPGDFVARYEEACFAVLLPITDSVGALIVAEDLRKAVEALALAPSCLGKRRVTVSLGVASIVPSKDLALPALIAASEKALVTARREEGNHVERAIL